MAMPQLETNAQYFKFNSNAATEPITRTLYPTTTCSSVIGLRFIDGVILAGDLLGSYGSLARFRNCSRVVKVNDQTILGASGDYADFQNMKERIDQMVVDEALLDDGFSMTAANLHSYLTRVLYYRRTKMNPYWNNFLVAGFKDTKPFLGQVDLLGVAFEAASCATGYGAYIVQPLLRNLLDAGERNITMEVAKDYIGTCMSVLFYRDARAFEKYQIATVTRDGVVVEGPLKVKQDWEVASVVKSAV